MAGFEEQNGVLTVDGHALDSIADQYGTPCYIYSGNHIRQQIHALKDALDKALPDGTNYLIAYACKANSNLAILKLIHNEGLGIDIVSGGEMHRALAAGVPANKVVFSGVGKSDEEIKEALENDLLQINAESDVELKRIQEIAKDLNVQAKVVLRYNPDVDADTHEKITTGKSENKFGINHSRLIETYRWASEQSHLNPIGISCHIGSQLTKVKPFEDAFTKIASLVGELRDLGQNVEVTDLGGGIGIPYKDETPADLDEYAKAILDHIIPLGTRIILEPGRFITGNAGILLTRTLYIKEGEERNYLILDAGMNDLIRPTLYDAYHAIRPVQNIHSDEMITYDVVGPICETGDTFAKNYSLPVLKRGDLVAIMSSGAYGFVMVSNYNTRGFPSEILVDQDNVKVIRERQTIQDIIKDDIIPDWL